MKKDSIFTEINLFIILVRVKCILPHYTKFQPKLLIRHRNFRKVNSPEATKDDQRNNEKFGQKHK